MSPACAACRSAASLDGLLRLFLGVRGLFSDAFLLLEDLAVSSPKSLMTCSRLAACLESVAHQGGIQPKLGCSLT